MDLVPLCCPGSIRRGEVGLSFLAGDGEFTRRCSAWLEGHVASNAGREFSARTEPCLGSSVTGVFRIPPVG